ncbi:MAG: hypothetical protein HY283_04040 [Nitrospirae bacterium]|nr:hypothetical protein [Nitrospirota bacterium]
MEENYGIKFQDYGLIILRRKWVLIIPAVLGLLCGTVALHYLTKSYRASALIVVEPPVISSDFVKTMGANTEERLGLLRQEIMSRKFLEPILREFDLYGVSSVGAEGVEDLVEGFRHHVSVNTSTSGSDRNIISFTVSFDGPDPRMVMEVTNKIAELFILHHQEAISLQVQGTTDFLETELNHLRTTLEKQEAVIAEFRRQHMGELPEQLTFNLQARERAQQDLKAISENLDNSTAKKTSMENLLTEGKEGDTIAGRLTELRRQLGQLMTRYKESYPDVYMTKQQIEQLEGLLRDGLARPEDPVVMPGPGSDGLRLQMREIDLTIDSLKRKKQSLEDQIHDYDQLINETPRREQDLMILMRDYENLKKNYQSLLDKRLTASLSKNMEAEQNGGTLRIIDPAYLPTKPFRPDPLRVMLISLVLGVGCGAGIVLLLEYGDASFRKAEELEQAIGLPVLAVIPVFPEAENVPLIQKSESVLK